MNENLLLSVKPEMLFSTISGKILVPTPFCTKYWLFNKGKMTVSNWDNWLRPAVPLLFWFLLLQAFTPTR